MPPKRMPICATWRKSLAPRHQDARIKGHARDCFSKHPNGQSGLRQPPLRFKAVFPGAILGAGELLRRERRRQQPPLVLGSTERRSEHWKKLKFSPRQLNKCIRPTNPTVCCDVESRRPTAANSQTAYSRKSLSTRNGAGHERQEFYSAMRFHALL